MGQVLTAISGDSDQNVHINDWLRGPDERSEEEDRIYSSNEEEEDNGREGLNNALGQCLRLLRTRIGVRLAHQLVNRRLQLVDLGRHLVDPSQHLLRLIGEFAGREAPGRRSGRARIDKEREPRQLLRPGDRLGQYPPATHQHHPLFSKDDTLVSRSHQDHITERIGSMSGYQFRLVDGYEHFRMENPVLVRTAVFPYV
jgi:hypothetical protein